MIEFDYGQTQKAVRAHSNVQPRGFFVKIDKLTHRTGKAQTIIEITLKSKGFFDKKRATIR